MAEKFLKRKQIEGLLNEQSNTTKLCLSVVEKGGEKLVRATILTGAGTSLMLRIKQKEFTVGMLDFLKELELSNC